MAQAQDLRTVKIVHTGPTSGSIAHIGKDTENGVSLAIDKLNSQNLVIDGKKIKFELVADDATLVLRVDTKKRADSVEPRAYLPFIGKTQCKDVTANIAFTSHGKRTKPSVTQYTGKDHVRAALNG